MTTYATASSHEEPYPGLIEVRSLIVGGLLLFTLFLLLFAPVVGVRPEETIGAWLLDPLQELAAGLAAVIAVLCLLRWRVGSDAQALHIGLAMALYGVSTLGIMDAGQLANSGIAASMLAALRPVSHVAMIALLGHALLVPPVGSGSKAGKAVLVTLVAPVMFASLLHASPVPSLGGALPRLLLFGLGVTYAVLGVQERRHLFAWIGVMLGGLALAELRFAIPTLAKPVASLDALCPAALLLGVLGSYRDVQQAFTAQRHRMLASQVTALKAEALARDLRTAQEERAHEASSALLAIEGATGTLEHRDLLDGDTRNALSAALQAEIVRLRAILDHAPSAYRPACFSVADALAPVVVCANAGGMRVRCTVGSDLYGWGNAAHIAQVVQQLLVNADRHAPGSPVAITGERNGDSIVLRVADHGPGVARHLRERIFERGYHSTASVEAGGHGFGLSIARQLIDDQGGVLWYEDRPGGGACFALRLPAERSDALSETGVGERWL